MFKNLRDTIKDLNADMKNVANCEKAKKLRKKLLGIGLTLAIVGMLGLITCFAMIFVTAINMQFNSVVFIPMIFFFPSGVLFALGTYISSLGFQIMVTGYTTNLIDETVGNVCPNCKESLNQNDLFCKKCGTKVRKECSSCGNINDFKSKFCSKCGNKLD